MRIMSRELNRPTTLDLQRVEPLASFICAADHPRAALTLAYSVLLNEVAQMSRAARAQAATYTRPAFRDVR